MLSTVALILIPGLVGYVIGKLAWLRTRKMENAKERMINILVPMRDLANHTREGIKNFQKDPLGWGESYYGSAGKLEEFSKFTIFNQIRIHDSSLYRDIMSFFTEVKRLGLFSRKARRDINQSTGITLNFFIPQETIEVEPEYREIKDLFRIKNTARSDLARILFPAILWNWDNNKIDRKSGKELREILARFSPLEVDMMAFVNHLRALEQETKSVRLYRETAQKILDSHESLIGNLETRIDKDTNLAHPEKLLRRR